MTMYVYVYYSMWQWQLMNMAYYVQAIFSLVLVSGKGIWYDDVDVECSHFMKWMKWKWNYFPFSIFTTISNSLREIIQPAKTCLKNILAEGMWERKTLLHSFSLLFSDVVEKSGLTRYAFFFVMMMGTSFLNVFMPFRRGMTLIWKKIKTPDKGYRAYKVNLNYTHWEKENDT